MSPFSDDTTLEAQQVVFELLRRTLPWKRVALRCELIQATRELMLIGLRSRFPAASEEETRRRFIARMLTREEVINAYGFAPVKEGYCGDED